MFDNFIPADPESPHHAAPANDCSQEGVWDDANLGNDDTSVGSPPLLPPGSPHPWDAIVLASEVTNTSVKAKTTPMGKATIVYSTSVRLSS